MLLRTGLAYSLFLPEWKAFILDFRYLLENLDSWNSWLFLRFKARLFQTVLPQLVVQKTAVDLEEFRGARSVASRGRQRALDQSALQFCYRAMQPVVEGE
jgi:hypothetical protein